MSSYFKRVTDIASFEGGSDCKYRHKCDFAKPRSPRLNQTALNSSRWCKFILMFLLILMYCTMFYQQMALDYNPWMVFLTYYSLWGIALAMFAQLFSIIACYRDGWFKTAYITTEISYAVNSFIMVGFWGILLPRLLSMAPQQPAQPAKPMSKFETFMAVQGVFVHILPYVSSVLDLYMTDMALEKSHWWIGFVALCPGYMIANLIGSMTLGSLIDRRIGTIYGYEDWTGAPV